MRSEDYFESLAETTIQIAKIFKNAKTAKPEDQFVDLSKTVESLTNDLKNLSDDFSKIAKHYQQDTKTKIFQDHVTNLTGQMNVGNSIASTTYSSLYYANLITMPKQKHFTILDSLESQLKNSITILRDDYQKYHLNQKFYPHSFTGEQLKVLTNSLSEQLKNLLSIKAKWKKL